MLSGPLGDFVFRPWLDAVSLGGIVHWLLPLSRAWAAGETAEGSAERFWAAIGRPTAARPIVERALAAQAERRRAFAAATAEWEARFFGSGPAPSGAELFAAEAQRAAAAQSWMAARNFYLPLHLHRPFPGLRWEIPSFETVEARHGHRLLHPETAFPAPAPVAVAQSRAAPAATAQISFLRFPSAVGGAPDTAWTRVLTPRGVADPPSLVFLHGVAMEVEYTGGEFASIDGLTERGIRVIRPEGPWHGRRREPGWYGGEPVMARGPLGFADLFAAWVGEAAQLIGWARETSRGPVAVGGLSLGAFTAQLVATVAARWPAALRPDALILLATTERVVEAATEGSLARSLGIGRKLAETGWTREALNRWRPLVAPLGAPVMEPARIIILTGEHDNVTPPAGALSLARRWHVPADNLFLRRQGHFSVALGLQRDAAPLTRLADLLFGKS